MILTRITLISLDLNALAVLKRIKLNTQKKIKNKNNSSYQIKIKSKCSVWMISHKCATVFIQWSRLFKNICGEYVLIPMRTPAVLLYNLYPRIGCKRNTLLPTLIACMNMNTCVCVWDTRARTFALEFQNFRFCILIWKR